MPFKSEAQRRYLWANEPEIARDWTDTYGSRIEKDDGGISQLVKSGPGRPGYQGPAGGASAGGNYGGNVNPQQEYAGRTFESRQNVGGPPGITTAPTHIPTVAPDTRPPQLGGSSTLENALKFKQMQAAQAKQKKYGRTVNQNPYSLNTVGPFGNLQDFKPNLNVSELETPDYDFSEIEGQIVDISQADIDAVLNNPLVQGMDDDTAAETVKMETGNQTLNAKDVNTIRKYKEKTKTTGKFAAHGGRIQKNNGGIMRLPFAEGSGEEVIVDDDGLTYEESPLSNFRTEDEFNEQFGETIDDTRWFEQPTVERMWNDPNRPEYFGLGSMRDWATDKFNLGKKKIGAGIGAGIDWSKMAMRGVGNLIAPGLGFVLGALPRDTAAQKFNRRFTVGGANMPTDTYGYYNQLRHGNIDQDPFGRNPVSMFGNYSKSLLGDVNYEGDSKFKKAKADYAQKYFNQKAAEYAPQEDININVTPAYSGGDNNRRDNDNKTSSRSRYSHADDAYSSFNRGGIASLWPR